MRGPEVMDLRGAARLPGELRYAPGDLLVVSGLPGSGKTTLMRRVVSGSVHGVDSQDTRRRLERLIPPWLPLPYGLYRPLVRLAHYLVLRRVLRSGTSAVVHDSGRFSLVRRMLAREARRRGTAVHLLLLVVEPETALAGQAARGRTVSAYAFARHRRAVTRLVAQVSGGRPPPGTASAVLLDRAGADALRTVGFGGTGARAADPASGRGRAEPGDPPSGPAGPSR